MKIVLKMIAFILVNIMALIIGVVGTLFITDAVAGVNNVYKKRDGEWQMYKVHNAEGAFNFLANGLTGFDLDGDNRNDWYLTQYEMEGNAYVYEVPSIDTVKTAESWKSTFVGNVENAESSCFADLNRDGTPEVLVSHGVERADSKSGVTVFQLKEGEWVKIGDFDNSVSDGHIHFIRSYDFNGDGFEDIICGGRGNTMAGTTEENYENVSYAGLFILINPEKTEDEIDLEGFSKITVDENLESGHGFTVGDINGDTLPDIAVCNSDFNTRPEDKAVIIYINNGNGFDKEIIYRDDTLYTKEQVVIGDIDGDSDNDILFHTEKDIIIFKNNGTGFDTVKIAKPDSTVQRSRMIYLADMNNDGRLDIIGGLIHHNGIIRRSKSSVFWMENMGDGTFETHTVKYSEGFIGLMEFNGEKWDLCMVQDFDGDGDLDIIADCEEYNRLTNVLSVVWFENPFVN